MKSIVVVGGGIIGLTTAYALRRQGAQVTVLEAGETGQGPSRVNAGWVCPSLSEPVPAPGLVRNSLSWMLRSDSPLYIQPRLDPGLAKWLLDFWRHCNERDYNAGLEATAALNRNTFALYDQMHADGIQFEQHQNGILFAYISPKALEHDLEAMEPMRNFGIDVPDAVWGDSIRAIEPALSDDINGGFWYRNERHVRPDTLTAGLTTWLIENGVKILQRCKVTRFESSDRRVDAVCVGSSCIPCEAVVLAGGAQTGLLAKLLGRELPIQAGKGYSIDFSPPPVTMKTAVYLHETRIAISPLDTMIRFAGTMEFSGFNDVIRTERVEAIAHGAGRGLRDWIPNPKDGVVGFGHRPMTPDGLPCIGWLPGTSNVAVAAGHAMLGVTLAPATGDAVAQLLMTGTIPAVAKPFDPARFA